MRNGASLLELVIAIVVMGIAMMTLPLMLTTTQKNNIFALQQEAILMARTQLGDIVTYRWDDKSSDGSQIAVLDTNDTYSNYNRYPDNSSNRRIGHVKGNKRRKFFNNMRYATSDTALGKEDSNYNDIDDFNDANLTLSDSSDTNTTQGYKLSDSNMSITVKYLNDTPPTNSSDAFDFNITKPLDTNQHSSNIKVITLTLKNSQLEHNLTIRAFSCNLGAGELLRRDF